HGDLDEVETAVETAELRVAPEPNIQSEPLDSDDLDIPAGIPGFEDQPVIEEIARATEARRRDRGDEVDDDAELSEGDAETDVGEVGEPNQPRKSTRSARPRRRLRSYKIQEVIKRRQIVLVQVVKEERGTKGAALTTYLSLAGRYTVLMPNTARGGGISRKITNAADRKRLKAIAQDLDVPEGMGLIIRTAGAARTKQEIKRDFEYLLRLWESVRELTLNSTAPALVYEEGNLIKRAIRDLYTKDVEEIVVSGGEAHREAKDFMRMLMPSHAKNVVKYDEQESVFKRYGIESQLNALFSPNVTLPSGGYLVINQTEALVAIDINSGRATREFSIEGTAHRTNTEAAEEIARQLKLRDLAGLIVIDFIDMEEKRNNRAVERKIKDCLKDDRARIQVGRISPFGLLEMSRQRLRTGMLEGSTSQCEHCQGTGIVRSVESVALAVIRGIEDAAEPDGSDLIVKTARDVAFYILNQKRTFITDLEARYGISIQVQFSEAQQGASFAIETPTGQRPPRRTGRSAVSMDHGFKGQASSAPSLAPTSPAPVTAIDVVTVDDDEDDNRKPRRRRRRRGGRRDDAPDTDDTNLAALDAEAQADDDDEAEADDTGRDGDQRRSRRRGRRSGQRGRGRDHRRDTEEGDDTGLVAGDE
ncbi:MAG: ribonuclease E/G, partial [Pseudomonadota bacterium]